MQGARAVLQHRTKQAPGLSEWLAKLASRTHHNLAHKTEYAVDIDPGRGVAVPLQTSDLGAIITFDETLAKVNMAFTELVGTGTPWELKNRAAKLLLRLFWPPPACAGSIER